MTDVAYYRRRLAEELAAVPRASCAKAAAAHRELAEIYRILLDRQEEPETVKFMVLEPDANAARADQAR